MHTFRVWKFGWSFDLNEARSEIKDGKLISTLNKIEISCYYCHTKVSISNHFNKQNIFSGGAEINFHPPESIGDIDEIISKVKKLSILS